MTGIPSFSLKWEPLSPVVRIHTGIGFLSKEIFIILSTNLKNMHGNKKGTLYGNKGGSICIITFIYFQCKVVTGNFKKFGQSKNTHLDFCSLGLCRQKSEKVFGHKFMPKQCEMHFQKDYIFGRDLSSPPSQWCRGVKLAKALAHGHDEIKNIYVLVV